MIDRYQLLKTFRKYLDDNISVTEQDWKKVVAATQIILIPRGKHLLKSGELNNKQVFILNGCLRTYQIGDTGKENTMLFKFENSWASEHESLSSQMPSRFNIEAIEHTWVAIINDADFISLYEYLPGFKQHINEIFRKAFVASNQRIHASYFLGASERYLQLLAHNPEVILRAPQHMVASYLQINAETLSRIKRKTTMRAKQAV
ncbi:Crp/Fnr family transcriptional regulator [Mucilaginibacter sp. cycad4]|uniref:Crp/Fnr family transcriptional regulator n=1 Tax=Mucilaginibacter sp. cycad4 TaxID=3342096 RepID=UPI002AAA90F9|nr:Crp/Fnr family transcriptional regulator [Mucilaginibacter gossypii]WPU99157.1 Crp/Fnr family transcriptional regulator [Mucilaginibacter gossypii]